MDAYIGQIILWPSARIPVRWQVCDGTLLKISEFQELYALIGVIYGGDGRTTFAVPDLRGRVPVGSGTLASSGYVVGQTGGQERVALTASQIPAHTHAFRVANAPPKSASPAGMFPANVSSNQRMYLDPSKLPAGVVPSIQVMAEAAVQSGGGNSQSHNNMMPTMALNYIICTKGIFPERAT